MIYYRTIRTDPLSLNQFLRPTPPHEEIVSEEILKARYHMDTIEIGKTYDGYAGLGLYTANTIVEQLVDDSDDGTG